MIKELVMICDTVCCLSSKEFARDDVHALTSYSICRLNDYSYFYFILYFFYVLSAYCAYLSCMHLEYDF